MKVYKTPAQQDATVEMWFERSWRSWAVRIVDVAGDQIGDTVYVASKEEAEEQVNEFRTAERAV